MSKRRNFDRRVGGAVGNKSKTHSSKPRSKKSMMSFTFEERRILLDLTNRGIKSKRATDFLRTPIPGMKTERLIFISNMIEKRVGQGGISHEKKKALETIMQKVLDVLNKRTRDFIKQSPNKITLGLKPKGKNKKN